MAQGWQPLTTLDWKNSPDTTTPLNASNLNNKVSGFISELDERTRTLDNVKLDINDAGGIVQRAENGAETSEAYAIGTRSGIPVTSDDPAYHNNSKYWSEQVGDEALKAEGYANGKQNGIPVGSSSPYYHNNAEYFKDQASQIAAQQLGALTDVTISAPTDGQVLTYDSNSGDWINANATGGLLPHVIISTTAGATVTLSKGGTTITTTETSSGVFECDVPNYGTWDITVANGGITLTDTIDIDAVKIYEKTVGGDGSTITVNYPDNMRGQTFTCVNGGITLTETAPSNANTFNFYPSTTGTWTVTGAYAKTAVIAAVGDVVTLTFVALKTFATATDAEIAAMVSEADLGFIDLADDCGWAVGQEHSVSLAAIDASGTYDGGAWSVGETQSAQTATLVLMHKGLYELVTPVLDKQGQTRNICSFICGLKECLDTTGYVNSAGSNTGSWNGSNRRSWCNGGFRGAIPSDLRGAFKQFKTITAQTYNGTTNEISQDYFALCAEKEILGASSFSNATEADALTQFTYYQTTANRTKTVSAVATEWWERSPSKNYATMFCKMSNAGAAGQASANQLKGISPFGCL